MTLVKLSILGKKKLQAVFEFLIFLTGTNMSAGKNTIKQISVPSQTEFSEENENDPCQVVYFEKKKLQAVLNFF